MPSMILPYINITLDVFALVITLIIFTSCLCEFSNKRNSSKHFLLYQISIIIALIADIVSWFGEIYSFLSCITLIANTVTACVCHIAIIGFMGYLISSLYPNNRSATCILYIFCALCGLSILFCIGNAFFGYEFYITEPGYYAPNVSSIVEILYLIYPLLSVFAIIIMTFLAKSSAKINRVAFFIYTLFPVAGVVLDYTFKGLSLTCAGFAVSILTIYTSIYLTRQNELEAQKNALMLSQINPHFTYNTLTTIAAMCDVSPKLAKSLTIDFSRYLRQNLDSMSSEALIPFDKELEHVECYLKIESARFREKLNVVYSVQQKDFCLPPLTVQPIVENAVKHGITKQANGGTVKISTYSEDNSYIIEVIDDGVGFDSDKVQFNVGIENVRSRIANICRGKLTVKSTLGVGTRVTIEIPKKKGKKR